mmetsp:Transcript_23092/g.32264  ORF Transcript_23092/g.32264 Transcript_23092/m.32264 type:complete len:283 (-) Transcript_23092:306-1154(-)
MSNSWMMPPFNEQNWEFRVEKSCTKDLKRLRLGSNGKCPKLKRMNRNMVKLEALAKMYRDCINDASNSSYATETESCTTETSHSSEENLRENKFDFLKDSSDCKDLDATITKTGKIEELRIMLPSNKRKSTSSVSHRPVSFSPFPNVVKLTNEDDGCDDEEHKTPCSLFTMTPNSGLTPSPSIENLQSILNNVDVGSNHHKHSPMSSPEALRIGEYLTCKENKLPALRRKKNKRRRIKRYPVEKMSPPLLPGMFDFNPSPNTCGEQSHLASPPITFTSLLPL